MRIEKTTCFIFAALMLFVFLLINSGLQPTELKKKVKEGELYVFYDDRQYWTELTDYCVKDDYIYILFGDKGVIKVYSTKGEYKTSYAFPVSKGESSMHVDKEYVYLCDQRCNFYVFSSGECVEFIEYNDYKSRNQKMCTFMANEDEKKKDGEEYCLRWVSICRSSIKSESQIIVYRPPCFVFFQGLVPYAMILLCLIALFILKLIGV